MKRLAKERVIALYEYNFRKKLYVEYLKNVEFFKNAAFLKKNEFLEKGHIFPNFNKFFKYFEFLKELGNFEKGHNQDISLELCGVQICMTDRLKWLSTLCYEIMIQIIQISDNFSSSYFDKTKTR